MITSERHLAQEKVWSKSASLLSSPIFPNQIFSINAILPIIWRVDVVWGEECFFPIKSQAILSSDCRQHFDGRKNSLIPSCCWWDSSLWHQHPWTLYLMSLVPAMLPSKPQGAWYTKRKEGTTKCFLRQGFDSSLVFSWASWGWWASHLNWRCSSRQWHPCEKAHYLQLNTARVNHSWWHAEKTMQSSASYSNC